MKYSEDTDEHRQANLNYGNERWRQLYGVQMDWENEKLKYLLLVNSGASAAMLAFLGAVHEARNLAWPKAMVGAFALGIVFIGVVHELRSSNVRMLFTKWRTDINEYLLDNRGWGDIVKDDVARSGRFNWANVPLYASFACFIVGIAIGLWNFTSLK